VFAGVFFVFRKTKPAGCRSSAHSSVTGGVKGIGRWVGGKWLDLLGD
jgi:hypothetical protein